MIQWLRAEIDRSDVAAAVGLLLLTGGVSMLSVPWALIVSGSLLFLLAVLPMLRGR